MAHRNWEKRIDAVRFLESDTEGSISDGLSDAKPVILLLKEWGVKASVAEDDHVEELFLELPEKSSPEIVEIIGKLRPDECDLDEDGILRIWWD